ncbi:hypothetical protein GIB67_008037 [Kingdonia uniflora]|uniref:Aminotransferase-like plant mobile domain-containing protein n=1 Tax=Kingdonia uniflora TaxID=39325 RepID=A0A7J7MN73_9MAGN|nr:hypothetical protein GIB67_008037 [Kingdonia uniflora]
MEVKEEEKKDRKCKGKHLEEEESTCSKGKGNGKGQREKQAITPKEKLKPRTSKAAYLLNIVGILLFTEKIGEYISPKYLELFKSVEKVGEYAWGTTILAYLYQEISSICSRKEKICPPWQKPDVSLKEVLQKLKEELEQYKLVKEEELKELKGVAEKLKKKERDFDALIESKNQLEEELAMIKGVKAKVETFGREDMAEKLKDKERECHDLRKHVSKLDEIREFGAAQEERKVLKEKLKNLGKVQEDKPETQAVVRNEVVKNSTELDELKLELVKLKQHLAVKEARVETRNSNNPTNDGFDATTYPKLRFGARYCGSLITISHNGTTVKSPG